MSTCRRHPIARNKQIKRTAANQDIMLCMWLRGASEKYMANTLGAPWNEPGHTNGSAIRTAVYKLARGHTVRNFMQDQETVLFNKLTVNRTGVPVTEREIGLINAMIKAKKKARYMARLCGRSIANMNQILDSDSNRKESLIC